MRYLPILTKLMAAALVAALVFSFIPVQPAGAFEQLPRSLRWELVYQSGARSYTPEGYPYSIHRVHAGETVNMWVEVKNRSSNPRAEVWYGKSTLFNEGPNYPNAHAIGIGTWDPMDHIPAFLDPSSFVINGNRLVYYDGVSVNKGGTMYLPWTVKIKDDIPAGTYNLVLSLVREFDEWGLRVTPSGVNHRYGGMLWKFEIGDIPPGTESWQTQSNNELGIAFRYPPTFAVGEGRTGSQQWMCTNRVTAQSQDLPIYDLSADKEKLFTFIFYDASFDSNNICDIYGKVTTSGTTQVSGRTAYRWSTGDAGWSSKMYSLANPDGNRVDISFASNTSYGLSWSNEEVERILSTVSLY